MYREWADTIDTRTVTVFTVASAIVGLAPALRGPETDMTVQVLLIAGCACWVLAAATSVAAYRVNAFRVDPAPSVPASDASMRLSPAECRYYRLCDMSVTDRFNGSRLPRELPGGVFHIARLRPSGFHLMPNALK